MKRNKGFTLIELLIAMAIFSIIMLMVVQFMSTTTGAYRKTKKNLNVQTEAQQTMEFISDSLMQANYIRVSSSDGKLYTIVADSTKKKTADSRVIKPVAEGLAFDFVPDNYGNYAKADDTERDVIIDYSTYQLVNKAGEAYPLEGDNDRYINAGTDSDDVIARNNNVRSFRYLSQGNGYYIKPQYIYIEYPTNTLTGHVIYYIKDSKVYMYRYESDDRKQYGYKFAKYEVNSIANKGDDSVEGLLTKMVKDFYLSANVDGNSVIANIMFENSGYLFNTVEPINFRNSNVLTVRPQKLYKKNGTSPGTIEIPGVTQITESTPSGETTPETGGTETPDTSGSASPGTGGETIPNATPTTD